MVVKREIWARKTSLKGTTGQNILICPFVGKKRGQNIGKNGHNTKIWVKKHEKRAETRIFDGVEERMVDFPISTARREKVAQIWEVKVYFAPSFGKIAGTGVNR